MRVGVVTSSYPAGPEDSSNAGVFVRDCARQLSADGHKVVVITPMSTSSAGEPFEVRGFSWPGRETSLTHIDPSRASNVLRLGALLVSGMAAVLRACRRDAPEHIIAMWAVPSGILALGAKLLCRTPYTVWALGSDIWEIDRYPLGRFVLRRVLRGATYLYADGYELVDEVERLSGRPCAFLASSRTLPLLDVQPRALDPDHVHVLAVARFHPHKGIDVLLDAVPLVSDATRKLLRVHVFGGGPDETTLRDRVTRLDIGDCVEIGGYLSPSELGSWMRSVSCLVIPSRIESIPLIITDAAQAGCPVIATDVGDLGRLVTTYRLGTLVPSEDPAALAAALDDLVANGIRHSAEGAAELVNEFSLAASCQRITEDLETSQRRAGHGGPFRRLVRSGRRR